MSCTAVDLPPDLVARVAEVAGTTRGAPRSAVRVHVIPSEARLDLSVTSRPLGPRLETCTLALATRSAVSGATSGPIAPSSRPPRS